MNLPAVRAPLPARSPRIPAAVCRLLPAVRGPVAVAAVGLAAEFALRALTNRALAALTPTPRPGAPARAPVAAVSRTVVTEIFVRERFRRPR